MKKVVISGSTSLQKNIAVWKKHFEDGGYDVIALPELWEDTKNFKSQLTELYTYFYDAIDKCDVFFLMNENKNGIQGYVGANCTAELIYAVTQNLRKNRGMDIYIAQLPGEDVAAYDEIMSYLRVGWIQLYEPTN